MIPTDDPRSKQTDRKKFMVRSLHTPRIVELVALDIAKREKITAPKEAVKKALRLLDIPDHYDPNLDPTMQACIEKVRKGLASE